MTARVLISLVLSVFVVGLAACASSSAPTQGFQAPPGSVVAGPGSLAQQEEYRLGPQDKISVRVFGVPALSVEDLEVDAAGRIVLPQVGELGAAGKTTAELSRELHGLLGQCCLQNPEVIVLLRESLSQRITVTGAVSSAGVFPIRGKTSLVQAIAMASGPDQRTANLNQVAIFRDIGGQRMVAIHNYNQILAGEAPDPEIISGDQIIVDHSGTRTLLRDIVGAIPVIGLFNPL